MTEDIDYNKMAEPPLKGNLSNGLNRDWLNWYRFSKGVSLREALEEGTRLLGITPLEQVEEDPEPVLTNGGLRRIPTAEWVKWYRAKHGVGLKEAYDAGVWKISEMPKEISQ